MNAVQLPTAVDGGLAAKEEEEEEEKSRLSDTRLAHRVESEANKEVESAGVYADALSTRHQHASRRSRFYRALSRFLSRLSFDGARLSPRC